MGWGTCKDCECFVEVGNMRRMNWTEIVCEPCRWTRETDAEAEANAASAAEYEATKEYNNAR